jgi:hypothetical protein
MAAPRVRGRSEVLPPNISRSSTPSIISSLTSGRGRQLQIKRSSLLPERSARCRPHSPVPPEPAAALAPAGPRVCGASQGTGPIPSSRLPGSGTSNPGRLRATQSSPSGCWRRTHTEARCSTARLQYDAVAFYPGLPNTVRDSGGASGAGRRTVGPTGSGLPIRARPEEMLGTPSAVGTRAHTV